MRDLARPAVRVGVAVASVVLGVSLVACSSDDTDSTPAPFAGAPVSIVDDLQAPWSIAFHGDAALVSERDTGRIVELRVDGDEVGAPRVVTTIGGVVHGG